MLQANQSFSAGTRKIAKGQMVSDDDPIVEGRALLFDRVGPEPQPTRRRARVRATVPGPVLDPPTVEG